MFVIRKTNKLSRQIKTLSTYLNKLIIENKKYYSSDSQINNNNNNNDINSSSSINNLLNTGDALNSSTENLVKPPSATKVVICGGGLFGTSVAYHLAQLGYKDVVLVTRDK